MWICTKCETFNEETSLVCCVCGNRRESTDAKCDTTRLESNFKSSMEDSDLPKVKRPDVARIPKPARETYKIEEGQESPEIPAELMPEKKEETEITISKPKADPANEVADIGTMPEPAPFTDNSENPFGGDWRGETAPVPQGPASPPQVQNTSGSKAPLILGLAALMAAVAGIVVYMVFFN